MTIEQAGCWPTPLQEKLLRAALCDGDVALESFAAWCSALGVDVLCGDALCIARLDTASQRLLPLLERNLKRLGVKDPLLPAFGTVSRHTWIQNQRLLARGADLLRELNEAGIPNLIFKGAGLTSSCYPHLALRPMNDFDILVPAARCSGAFNFVLAHGWNWDPPKTAASLRDGHTQVSHSENFRDARGFVVDLHRRLWHQRGSQIADGDFWEASVPVELFGVKTRTLCACDHLLVALMHGVRWDRIAPLRWIADAMAILSADSHSSADGSALDWDRFLEQTRKRGLALPVSAGLSYLKNTFGAAVPNSVLARLEEFPVTTRQKMDFEGWTSFSDDHTPTLRLYRLAEVFLQWQNCSNWRERLFGLPMHLQNFWNLNSPWQVPLYAYVRAVQRTRTFLQARWRKAS